MTTITENLNKNKKKIITISLLLILLALGGFTAYTVYSPIDAELETELRSKIIGKDINFEEKIITSIEKRQNFGRSIEIRYIQENREAFTAACNEDPRCVPNNFFSPCRLVKFYNLSKAERQDVGC